MDEERSEKAKFSIDTKDLQSPEFVVNSLNAVIILHT